MAEGLDPVEVKEGVDAVFKLVKSRKQIASGKRGLFDFSDNIMMYVCVKKIPPISKNKRINIHLPHSLITSTTDVCLIVPDVMGSGREYQRSLVKAREKLEKNNITGINEVISLHMLRVEYKPHEAKRKFCQSHDFFMADRSLAGFLPRLLGKEFFISRKFPTFVDWKAENLQAEFKRKMSSTGLTVHGRGSSYVFTVGRIGMGIEAVCDNINKVCKAMAVRLPGGWSNVSSLNIKTEATPSVPIYYSFTRPVDVVFERPKKEEVKAEEVTTVIKGLVKVYPKGKIKVIKEDKNDSKEELEDKTTPCNDILERPKKEEVEADEVTTVTKESVKVYHKGKIKVVKEESESEESDSEVELEDNRKPKRRTHNVKRTKPYAPPPVKPKRRRKVLTVYKNKKMKTGD